MPSVGFKIGPLYPKSKDDITVPMYSYDKPSERFWTGVYDSLTFFGLTNDQALEMLQHGAMRNMLDHYEDEIQTLGHHLANKYFSEEVNRKLLEEIKAQPIRELSAHDGMVLSVIARSLNHKKNLLNELAESVSPEIQIIAKLMIDPDIDATEEQREEAKAMLEWINVTCKQ